MLSQRNRTKQIFSFQHLEGFIKSFNLPPLEKWFARKLAGDVCYFGGIVPNIECIHLEHSHRKKLSRRDVDALLLSLCAHGVLKHDATCPKWRDYAFACNPESEPKVVWLKWYQEEYLKSDHWTEVRKRALDFAENRCQLCDWSENLEVHHRSYRTLHKEKLCDVVVLCSVCHSEFHGKTRL